MQITGTDGPDALDGSADPDAIEGHEGDDRLYGHGGDDTLEGDDGNDLLAGGDGDDLLDGGAGDDRLWGGEGADTIVFRDGYGHDVVMDFDVAAGRVALVSHGVTGWDDVAARLTPDHDGAALLRLDDGSTLRFEGLTVDDLRPENFDLPPPPVCLAAGTRIALPLGSAAVEDLRPGDRVLTLDDGAQPVLWVGRRQTRFGHGRHAHRPVLIRSGAMGGGLPSADLRLSPQHRLLVQGPPARRFAAGALAKAKGLCGRPGIAQEDACTAVDYLQVLLPRHGLMIANGLPAESFLPRAFALSCLGRADRAAILALVPALRDDPEGGYGPPARPILSMQALARLPDAALRCPPAVAAALNPSRNAARSAA